MRRRKCVLVVEDDHDLRQLFRTSLSFGGFDTRGAADGVEALRLLEAEPPDVVVLDLVLPTLDGYAVREEIAANARTHDIPVVIVTGYEGDYARLQPARVLKKPVAPDDLVAAVRASIAGIIKRQRANLRSR